MATPPPPDAGPTLSETAQVYVSGTAALTYAAERGLQPEEARRELTVLLLGARRKADARNGAECWRAKSRALRVDVDAHVRREAGPLAVVVHVHVRYLSPKTRGGAGR